jgi:exopolysaccharide biosynthesis protein
MNVLRLLKIGRWMSLLASIAAFAQSPADSAVIARASWQTTDIGQGVTWKKIHWSQKELFNSNQSLNILETKRRNRKIRFGLASADSLTKQDKTKGQLTKTSELALRNRALAAVNGGFFDVKNGGSVDFIKINGQVIDTTRGGSPTALVFHSQAAITIHKNRVTIVKGEKKWGWENALKADNVLLTGPLLMLNGKEETLEKTAFNTNRHPRTCACVTHDKRLLLIAVDGRTNQAYGMNLSELTFLAKQLGCRDVINFDGGGSTTMYVAGQPDNGVVNYPCDNRLFDHAGERAVSNIFFITSPQPRRGAPKVGSK